MLSDSDDSEKEHVHLKKVRINDDSFEIYTQKFILGIIRFSFAKKKRTDIKTDIKYCKDTHIVEQQLELIQTNLKLQLS